MTMMVTMMTNNQKQYIMLLEGSRGSYTTPRFTSSIAGCWFFINYKVAYWHKSTTLLGHKTRHKWLPDSFYTSRCSCGALGRFFCVCVCVYITGSEISLSEIWTDATSDDAGITRPRNDYIFPTPKIDKKQQDSMYCWVCDLRKQKKNTYWCV